MKIIPAIDIMDGKCVRLTQGNYSRCKLYSVSPLEVAREFEAVGFTRLHLVDLDGAKAAGVVNIRVLEEICKHTSLTVDFGGGVKTDEDIRKVFDAGAKFVCLGSIVQTNVEKTRDWLIKYGSENIILGADVWHTKVCIQGWKKRTDTTIYQLVESYRGLFRNLMCTDITKDGMLSGPAPELYRSLLKSYPELYVIASGGIGSLKDLDELKALGVNAVVVGKALYEKKIILDELVNY